jgi:8-oxo-dGTP pyrophosphatase MutT (NUDIX family)
MPMETADLKNLLQARLAAGTRKTVDIPGFRKAAVLVPLMGAGDECTMLFTRRTETVETHKGQISFPGGMVDEWDANSAETALREAREEIGLGREHVEVLGLLDDLATPAGFVITPVVGFVASRPPLLLNRAEVAEAFEVSLRFFADPASGTMEIRRVNGREYEVWSYDTGEHVIWGATAKIVRTLLARIGMI